MEYSNEPMDPLPEVLPDVDLPCTCGHDGRCNNGGKRCANYRLATLYFASGKPFYKPKDRNTRAGFVYRVPWSLVRAALAQTAEVKFYGTQPKELPATLPIGTIFKAPGRGHIASRTQPELRHLNALNIDAYWAYWGDDGIETWVRPELIDWATTPIQPARAREDAAATPSGGALADSTQPPEPERLCVACNAKLCGAGERCVYCEKRRDDHLSGRESNVKPSDLDERIAAARASIKPEKQRKPIEHPTAFPEDAFLDAPSCDP